MVVSSRLRVIRQHARTAFDARFYERHEDFWPIARAASTFADYQDEWPRVSDYAKAYRAAGERPVRFEEAPPKRKRPSGIIDRDKLYDAMIVKQGIVPTRPRMWHDYLNALVWMTFPRAKLAFHRRQHAAIERWIPEGATQLPNARSRELDALALVDEGGILMLDWGPDARRPPARVVFGHALFEGLVFEQPAMISRGLVLDARGHDVEVRGRDVDARGRDVDARDRDVDARDRDVDARDVDARGRGLDDTAFAAGSSAAERADRAAEHEALVTLADTLLAEYLADETRIVSTEELPRRGLPS